MHRRHLRKLQPLLPYIGRLNDALAGGARVHTRQSTPPATACIDARPGEVTQLLGRPRNGKTTVAFSMALEHIEAGKGPVWFFSGTQNSREIAEKNHLQLSPVEGKTFGKDLMIEDRPEWRSYQTERAYSARLQGSATPLPLTFIDSWNPEALQLAAPQGFSAENPPPTLVIYDMDHIDIAASHAPNYYALAKAFYARKLEARALGNTRIVITLGLPEIVPFGPHEKRPQLSDFPFRPRKAKALSDEIYLIYRPSRYEAEFYMRSSEGRPTRVRNQFVPDYIEIARCNRVTLDRKSYSRIRDKATGRLRELNDEENQRIFDWLG
jgi:hypothetical protein